MKGKRDTWWTEEGWKIVLVDFDNAQDNRLDIQPRNNVQNFIDARRIASSALIYGVSFFQLDKYHDGKNK